VVAYTAATVLVYRQGHDPVLTGYWIFTSALTLWSMISFVTGANRYTHLPPARGRVLAIMPAFNETEEAVEAGVRAVLAQTVDVDIIVVDDGSAVPLRGFDHPRVRWARQDNAGKRHAQRTALLMTEPGEYEFVFTVDTDSAPFPDSLEHLLRAMSEPDVWCATGWVITRNYRDSWIARCADLDIGLALVMNRSSRTQLGAIETMSGAIALYRARLFWDHIDEYVEDTVGAGDDRWLTARALLRGKAVGVNEAIVETDMPAGVAKTFKQRVRWSKSTYLMAGWSFKHYTVRQVVPPVLNFINIVSMPITMLFLMFTAVRLLASGHPIGGFTWEWLAVFAVAGIMSKIALCALYLIDRPNMPARQKALSGLVGATLLFVYGLFAIQAPKYWALTQLRDTGWNTRGAAGDTTAVYAPRHSEEDTETGVLDGRQLDAMLAAGQLRAQLGQHAVPHIGETAVRGDRPVVDPDATAVFGPVDDLERTRFDVDAAWLNRGPYGGVAPETSTAALR
jgi:cellulose synthase/poly-beta-1,6-N-acetylglucosamine synthase-like glycosyltransferase